ncbi:YciI family protein [Dyella humicola]|uniref:YciI family protein n=1 Tax=Dyella humicola TaxID=2992126 RepID=UPI00225BE325|nr:YciI family protein [Dyella humicola]
MKFLMFYELAPDGLSKVQANLPGHQSRLREFHTGGSLLMAGPYGAPPLGAVGIFTSREAADEFIAGDPFVLNGVVGKYSIHEWFEVLAP